MKTKVKQLTQEIKKLEDELKATQKLMMIEYVKPINEKMRNKYYKEHRACDTTSLCYVRIDEV